MADYYDEIGFADESIGSNRVERYKGRKDYTDRIGFVLPARILKAKVHYKDKYILCDGGLCCEKLGPPSWRLGTVVVQYGTNKAGSVEKPLAYTVKQWVFSGKKYEDLRDVNDEWPLTDHDLKISCIEEGFQQLRFIACKDSIWQANPKIKARILKEAETALDSVYLGSKMDSDELRDHLGIEVEPDDGWDPSDDGNFDDMLDGMDLADEG